MHLHFRVRLELLRSAKDKIFLNLHPSALGNMEFSHVETCLDIGCKMAVPHWQIDKIQRLRDDRISGGRGWKLGILQEV